VRVILTAFRESPDCTGRRHRHRAHVAHQAIVAQQPTKPSSRHARRPPTVLAIDSVHNFAVVGPRRRHALVLLPRRRDRRQTKDHSVVQKMVDAGYLAQAAIRKSSERSKLFAALGHNEAFEARSRGSQFPIRAGRRVSCCCTDGFWEYVDGTDDGGRAVARKLGGGWLQEMVDDVVRAAGASRTISPRSAVFCRDAGPEDPDATKVV
jgi:hypothetical protein